jgi:uncharacterized protein
MKLAGAHLFPVERERLWAALLDPTLLVRVMPGCEPMESVGENHWKMAMTVAVGPVQGRFQGSLELADLAAPESYRMKLDGSGPAGFMRGTGTVRLAAEGGSTRLTYELEAHVGGKVASVGQRLVESSARALARQGLEGLEKELGARAALAAAAPAASATPPANPSGSAPAGRSAGSGAAAPVSAPPAPSSKAAFALGFARRLWPELPLAFRLGIAALGAILVLGVVLLLRGC